MPRYRTQVAHNLGQREAVARLKANAEAARAFFDLEGAWSGNTYTFAASVQGIGLKGTLEVGEDALKLDSRLPLVAMPFVGWLPRVLNKALSRRLHLQDTTTETNEDETVARERDAARDDASAPAVLFLHLPKAGGTTLGDFVYNQCRADAEHDEMLLNAGVLFLPYGFFKEADLAVPEPVRPLLRRADLRAVIGHFWFGLHEYVARPSTYITLLRNPVERVVSLYHYLKLEGRMSLEEFASHPPYREVDNDQTRRIAGVNPDIGDCTEATLRAAQENLRRHFSVVGVTERFDETLVLLKLRLGWRRDVLSYPKNTNPERPPTAALARETVAAIERRNELDFKLWRFAEQLLDEAIAAEGAAFRTELESYRRRRPAPPELSGAERASAGE